jgi:photosystem II stability/assembly factor-like uncharacterized protein
VPVPGAVVAVSKPWAYWTGDGGRTWRDLGVRVDAYYPRGLWEPTAGRLLLVGQSGSDNAYGTDSQILMQTITMDVAR